MRTRISLLSVLCIVIGVGAVAQDPARTLTTTMPEKIANRAMQPISEGTWRGLRLDARAGDGIAWWPDVQFGNGTIELDILGRNAQGQSFVGIAFHGRDETTFDGIYFRPFNFNAPAALNRSHAVQYISHPTYTWDKLRSEHAGRYEAALAAPADADTWFHARIEVAFPSVKVFVNGAATPVLSVEQLSDRKTGWVGVWVGNGSDGAFANLTIRPSRP
jgi:hypothetical protein